MELFQGLNHCDPRCRCCDQLAADIDAFDGLMNVDRNDHRQVVQRHYCPLNHQPHRWPVTRRWYADAMVVVLAAS